MANPIHGILEIQTDPPGGLTRIVLNPDAADVNAGGNGQNGEYIVKNMNGAEVARLGHIQELSANPNEPTPTVIANYIGLRVRTPEGVNLVQLGRIPSFLGQISPPEEIENIFGGTGFSGTLRLVDKANKTRFLLGRDDQGNDGRLIVFAANGKKLLEFDPVTAALYVGAEGREGDLILRDNAGQDSVKLDGAGRSLRLGTASQPRIRLESGNAWLGGHGDDGDLILFSSGGDNVTLGESTVHINGSIARMRMGGNGTNGEVRLQTTDGRNRVRLEAAGGNLWLGGNGADGDLVIFSSSGDNQTTASASIHLNGDAGDIILRNADCAEEFELASDAPEPGTVMVLDDAGRLEVCRAAYDKRVAGVVSGADGHRPGIILDHQNSDELRAAIALAGKAYCKVDARYGPIEAGDLLTSSPTPGHAMKASDPGRAFGAVIGKALRPLPAGAGRIPVLIALQ